MACSDRKMIPALPVLVSTQSTRVVIVRLEKWVVVVEVENPPGFLP